MATHAYEFASGTYRMTWGGAVLGQTEEGVRFDLVYAGEPVRGDNLAETVQDIIYRGGNVFAEFTLIEYKKAEAAKVFFPWNATFGTVGIIGRMAQLSTLSKALVLTAVSGAPCFYATITADQAILAEGHSIGHLLGPTLHRVPIRLQLLPSGAVDAEKWFTAAAA